MQAQREVFLALGGNVGNVREAFNTALKILSYSVGPLTRVSSLYRAYPLNPPELADTGQPVFLNCVVACRSKLDPVEILSRINEIETILGRDRAHELRWGPRRIDIDILLFGTEVVDTADLKIPHPEMQHRDFVLIPLAEIAPETIHPILGRSVSELLRELKQSLSSELVIETIAWGNEQSVSVGNLQA